MTAPYLVWIDHAGDHRYIECGTLAEAIEQAKAVTPHRHQHVRVIGDGAEGGYGDDGTRFHDGLSDAEREIVEEALP